MQADSYLIDVRADAFHSLVDLGKSTAIGSKVNPRTNAVTDILRFVFVPVLIALRKYILHFGFREAYIERVGLLFFLTFQVLAFIIGKFALRLVCKGIVKLGLHLFVQGVVDSSIIAHA